MDNRRVPITRQQFMEFSALKSEAGLSDAQLRLMIACGDYSRRMRDLATDLGVRFQNLTHVADGLVELKMLRSEAVQGDRRGRQICVTKSGKEALAKLFV